MVVDKYRCQVKGGAGTWMLTIQMSSQRRGWDMDVDNTDVKSKKGGFQCALGAIFREPP